MPGISGILKFQKLMLPSFTYTHTTGYRYIYVCVLMIRKSLFKSFKFLLKNFYQNGTNHM